MSTDSKDGYSKRIRFLLENGNCIATGNIYFRDSARSAFHKLFTWVSNSSRPVPLFAISLELIKDGPGDLCFVQKVGATDGGDAVPGKSTIYFLRGNISVHLRAENEEFDMFPIAKEMDAMIVAAMAKAEVAAKEKAEKDKVAAAEAARLAEEAAKKAATDKATPEREMNKW